MAQPQAKQVFNGTFGTVWVNNELWSETDTFEATVTVDYDDVTFANTPSNQRKMLGWTGTGSMTIKKIHSRVQKIMADEIRAGRSPRLKIVGKIADPDALGNQRIALYDVTLDNFALLKFEQKTLTSEEISFAFSDYELVDTIA
jgi:hypothetical protein